MGCRRPSEPSMTTSQWRRSVTGDAPGRQNAGGSSHIMRSSLRIRLLRGSSNPILPHYQVRLMISRRVAAPTGEGNPIPSGQGCVGTRYGRASAGEIDRVPVSTRHPTCRSMYRRYSVSDSNVVECLFRDTTSEAQYLPTGEKKGNVRGM